MVDADHAQWGSLGPSGQVNGHCGLIEGRGDSIYRDRIMRVRAGGNGLDQCLQARKDENLRIGAHVANDG